MSSTISGKLANIAGINPDAFQLALMGLLNTPSGASNMKGYKSYPKTALKRSLASRACTYKRYTVCPGITLGLLSTNTVYSPSPVGEQEQYSQDASSTLAMKS